MQVIGCCPGSGRVWFSKLSGMFHNEELGTALWPIPMYGMIFLEMLLFSGPLFSRIKIRNCKEVFGAGSAWLCLRVALSILLVDSGSSIVGRQFGAPRFLSLGSSRRPHHLQNLLSFDPQWHLFVPKSTPTRLLQRSREQKNSIHRAFYSCAFATFRAVSRCNLDTSRVEGCDRGSLVAALHLTAMF